MAEPDGTPCGLLSYSLRKSLELNKFSCSIQTLLLSMSQIIKSTKLSQSPVISCGLNNSTPNSVVFSIPKQNIKPPSKSNVQSRQIQNKRIQNKQVQNKRVLSKPVQNVLAQNVFLEDNCKKSKKHKKNNKHKIDNKLKKDNKHKHKNKTNIFDSIINFIKIFEFVD